MSLFTQCILRKRDEIGGKRISVMSRHTLDDGVTPDERIVKGRNYDVHWPILGPSPKLIGAYKRGEITWSEFARCYKEELNEPKRNKKGEVVIDEKAPPKYIHMGHRWEGLYYHGRARIERLVVPGRKARWVKKLADMAIKRHMTILCIEESHSQCHRRLLADACLKYQLGLSITHRC